MCKYNQGSNLNSVFFFFLTKTNKAEKMMITTPISLCVDSSLIHPGKVLEVKTIDGFLYEQNAYFSIPLVLANAGAFRSVRKSISMDVSVSD